MSSSSNEEGLVEENHNNENSEGDLDVETEETNGVLHEPEGTRHYSVDKISTG